MFNENSALVEVWIRLIKQGVYTFNEIPNLSNLQDVIAEVLLEKEDTANEQGQKAEAFDYITGRGETNE